VDLNPVFELPGRDFRLQFIDDRQRTGRLTAGAGATGQTNFKMLLLGEFRGSFCFKFFGFHSVPVSS
jgi:hypothetical protein